MKISRAYASSMTLSLVLALGACGGGETSSNTRSGGGSPPAISDASPPSTPSNLAAHATSSSAIGLSWNASTDDVGVSGYRLERCQGASCTSFTQIATPTGTTYSDTGLAASTTYRYRVSARDAAGNMSSPSTAVSATTQATTPPPSSSSPETICPGGSSPDPNVILCEDFDAGTPPTNPWPCRDAPYWHDWRPSQYGNALGCNAINATAAHSNATGYAITKRSGTNDTIDLEHPLGGNYPALNVRFYMYIPAGSASEIMNTSSIHFVFIGPNNPADSSIDFRRRSEPFCGTACPPPNTHGENNSGYKWSDHAMLALHTYSSTFVPGGEDWAVETEGTPFFWEQHENEWHLVEVRFDFANSRVAMWIDENQIVRDYPMSFPYSSVNTMTWSGYGNITTTAYGIYVDDVVVSTTYIGPRVN
jgi:hypothetical protein